MKKRKNLVVGLLVMLAVVMSTLTFAYWANSIDDANNTATGTIDIGAGGNVTTSVTVGNQTNAGELVPTGHENDSTTFDEISLTFTVDWSGTGAEGAAGTLAVTADSVLVGATDVSSLISVVVTSGDGAIVAGTPQNVVIKVTFHTEPANANDYSLIANGDLIVTLSFDVTAA